MDTYEVYKHPTLGQEVIKQGFSWPAFFLGWAWALYKKLWIIAGAFFVVFFIVSAVTGSIIGNRLDVGEAIVSMMLYSLPMFIMGYKGNEWRKDSMRQRGFALISEIEADTVDAALSQLSLASGPLQKTPSTSLDDTIASKAMYEIISDEMDDDRANRVLWMQSLEQSGGDTNKQKAMYLKLRTTTFKQNLSKANLNLQGLLESSVNDDDPPCDRELLSDAYRIWLMTKYSIDHQVSSGKFTHSGKSFSSLNRAIAFAHVLDKQESKNRKEILARRQQVKRMECRNKMGAYLHLISAI